MFLHPLERPLLTHPTLFDGEGNDKHTFQELHKTLMALG